MKLLCGIHVKNPSQKLSYRNRSLHSAAVFFVTVAWSYGNAWRIRSSLFIPGRWSHVHNRYWHVVEWRRRTDLREENTSGECLNEIVIFHHVRQVTQFYLLTRGTFYSTKTCALNFRKFLVASGTTLFGISEKRYPHCLQISIRFDFPPRIFWNFRLNGSHFGNATILTLPETFQGYFRTNAVEWKEPQVINRLIAVLN